MMKRYEDFDTGETYTLEEIKDIYKQFADEMDYPNFDAYFEYQLDLGRQKIGGYIEVIK